MKQVLLVLAAFLLLAGHAHAARVDYGWEDGNTILGQYSDLSAHNVDTYAYSGDNCLELIDGGASGTPQAFVGWIQGLQDGDQVTAGFWVYDITPGSSPSGRIWGHYTDDDADIDSYAGSASGSYSYGDISGWNYLEYTWTFDAGSDHSGLIIEARTYSGLNDTIWVDELTIIAPDHARIITPGGSSAVPVPGGMVLLGFGLTCLAGLNRKK